MRVQRLLMTRFNIRSPAVGHTSTQARGWLDRRFELFERYCLPGVQAQTVAFDWLLFCDAESPPDVPERLRSYDSRIRVVPVPASLDRRRVQPELFAHRHADADLVISTRLDSDDMLLPGALDRVESFARPGTPRLLYNPRLGYKLHAPSGRLYETEMHNSPFLSLIETVKPLGPLSGNHTHMHLRYPTVQDDGARLWVQVIHTGNVSNHITPRDRQVSATDFQVLTPMRV